MALKQTRLVTTDVAKLTRFYESVSQATATVLSGGYAKFEGEPCEGLAIIDEASIRSYGEGVAESGADRSVILVFEVADVDAEYERLQESVSDWVMPPTVQPWGAKLEELSALANIETARIEALNRRVVVAGRVTAAPLLISGSAMAALSPRTAETS
jgi:uncharacterized glyoxalase superfamily protein PhnB